MSFELFKKSCFPFCIDESYTNFDLLPNFYTEVVFY